MSIRWEIIFGSHSHFKCIRRKMINPMKLKYVSLFLIAPGLLILAMLGTGQIRTKAAANFDPALVGYRETMTGLTEPVYHHQCRRWLRASIYCRKSRADSPV